MRQARLRLYTNYLVQLSEGPSENVLLSALCRAGTKLKGVQCFVLEVPGLRNQRYNLNGRNLTPEPSSSSR